MTPAPYNPATLNLIRDLARKRDGDSIADALQWPRSRLTSICERHGIRLIAGNMVGRNEGDDDDVDTSISERGQNRQQVHASFTLADRKAIAKEAYARGERVAVMLRKVVETIASSRTLRERFHPGEAARGHRDGTRSRHASGFRRDFPVTLAISPKALDWLERTGNACGKLTVAAIAGCWIEAVLTANAWADVLDGSSPRKTKPHGDACES